ncbi:hypothetical protein ACSBR2_027281 [Camellia fascicularis]
MDEEEEEEEMSDYLPEELWIRNILPTLSIKTLLRCTSICKSWYSLITSPSFISTHLNRNKQQDPPLLLLRQCSERPRKEHFSIHHDNPTLDDYVELDFPFHSVNWVTYVEDDDGFDIVPPEVELYSLSRGCWQSISYCGLQSIIPERSPQVYINGAVHWIAYDRKTNGSIRRSLIVSFNMCDELFREIFLPESLAAQCGIDIEINVFGESLCVMHDVFLSGSNQTYDMWVMEKYSVVESWTKLFAIVDYQQSLGPVIGFRKNSEVLLE